MRSGIQEIIALIMKMFQGNAALRQQITRLAFNWGGKVNPEEVIIIRLPGSSDHVPEGCNCLWRYCGC